MDIRYVFLLGLLVFQTIAQVTKPVDDRGPEPGNCVYTLNIPTSALRGSCMTEKFQREMDEMRAEFTRISQENIELKTSLEEVVQDYQQMVDTVQTLKKDTDSWRQVVQWPSYEEMFKPEDFNEEPISNKKYVDCYQAYRRGETKQGIYLLAPEGVQNPFYGYCVDDGWTVIFRRFDGSVDFNRLWFEYSMGFGNLTGEFFIGLESLFQMTSRAPHELKVEALGYNMKRYKAVYPDFIVGDEEDQYPLLVGNMTKGGDFNDDFAVDQAIGFSARDRDNDLWSEGHCAYHYQGGWWLKNCGSNPSAPYCEYDSCMGWGGKNVKRLVMSIRPSSASEGSRRDPDDRPRRRNNENALNDEGN